MSDRANRKARQRQRREKKRQAIRRAASVSPYKRAAAGALVACRVNADWRGRGQAAVYVLRRPPGPGAGLAMATFFVDLWCAGLKTVWGRFDMVREEFDDIVERMGDRMDARMPDVPVEQAAAIVAGGIRFTVQNGFRLPTHLQRWTAFLGGKLDWQHADLSAFGVEGGTKLRWVAPLEDLRSRLIGTTVEQFIARPDVEFIGEVGGVMTAGGFDEEWDEAYAADEDYEEGDDEGDAGGRDVPLDRRRLEDAEVISATDGPVVDRTAEPVPNRFAAEFQPGPTGPGAPEPADADREREEGYQHFVRMTRNVIAAVQAWCFNEGLVPSRQLGKAAAFMLASGAMTAGGAATEDPDPDEILDRLLQTVPDEEVEDVEAGVQQVDRFVRTYRNPAALMAALEAAAAATGGAQRKPPPPPQGDPEASGKTAPMSDEPKPQPAISSESAGPNA